MNAKQKSFCDYYLISLNACEAAEKAGYNRHSSGLLMQKDYIKNYIESKMQEVDYTRIATLDEILSKLTQIVRGEYFNDDDKKTRVSNIIKACELLGKRFGAWDDNKTINFNNLTIVNDIKKEDLEEAKNMLASDVIDITET